MKIIAKIVFLIVLAVFVSCTNKTKTTKHSDSDIMQWKFQYNGSWYDAMVPGNIHTDLLKNRLIADPFFGDNENNLQWIGEQAWRYKTDFDIAKIDLKHHIELVFDGLDTYCHILLNGNEIGKADNMFHEWIFDIGEFVNEGKNTLEVIFDPATQFNDSMAAKLAYKLPDNRVFTRKAPYHSGWDWGPKYETCGIWKSVHLRYWNSFRISDFSVKTKQITDSKAEMQAMISVDSDLKQTARLILFTDSNENVIVTKKIALKPGSNEFTIDFSMANPNLWHCNQRGNPTLYRFSIQLEANSLLDTAICITGIRVATLISEPDSIGQSFYFVLNGEPVFAKGANWIPMESFPGSVSRDKYRKLLVLAREAGFNMLRVWGGGYYEDDAFYEICDSLGIMVWQDFMFACAVYPGDNDFTHNVEAEIQFQVKRLRHHPCLVLWCGNNEVSNGWNDWGWQHALGYSTADSTKIWEHNRYLFEELIPKIIRQSDPLTSYWESSPMYGWGHPENNTHGDAHYWGVWWGKEDFEEYYNKTGRFMSEYGFQGMPSMQTITMMADSSSLQIANPQISNHQKHPFGFENINEFMQKYLFKPSSFDEYVYLSQVLQATAMQTAFDAHFSEAPRCMGSLFWQYNDCWPSISWSAVDYYLNPKALYYLAKRMFRPIGIYYRPQQKHPGFYVFSDIENIANCRAVAELCDFSGNVVTHTETKVDIIANQSVAIIFDKLQLDDKIKPSDHYLKLCIYNQQQLIGERVFFFERDSKLNLLLPNIKVTQTQTGDSITLNISADKLARWVFLEADNMTFSDNYFDLLPGETRIITAKPISTNKQVNPMIRHYCMNFYKSH